jgi:hypothetical protein
MSVTIDILLLRRPKIDYISPPVCELVLSGSGFSEVVISPFSIATIEGISLVNPGGDGGGGGDEGGNVIEWTPFPGALCYTVYQAVNPDEPDGDYVVLRDCITPDECENSPGHLCFPLPSPGCFKISAITLEGESALSAPVCTPSNCLQPAAFTLSANNITSVSARLNGEANPAGTAATAFFEYGTTIAYGSSTTPQAIGSGMSNVAFNATITGLLPDTNYHFRSVVQNTCGTIRGPDRDFLTTATGGGQVVTVAASVPDAFDSGEIPGAFTIFRSGDISNPVVIHFTITGTSTEGADFETIGVTANMPANQSSVVVPVTPIDPGMPAADTTVILTVITGDYSIGAPGDATVTIHHNSTVNAPRSLFEPDNSVFGSIDLSNCADYPSGGVMCEIAGLEIGSYLWDYISGVTSPPPCAFVVSGSGGGGCSGQGVTIGHQWYDGVEQDPVGGNFDDFPTNTGGPCFTTEEAEADYETKSLPGFFVREPDGIGRLRSCIDPTNPIIFNLKRVSKLKRPQPRVLTAENIAEFADSRFEITYSAQTTSPLTLSANAATVQAALNLLPAIIADGGVICAGTLAGGMTVTWNLNGARTALNTTITTISPGYYSESVETQAGTGAQPEIQTLTVAAVCSSIFAGTGLPLWDGVIDNRHLEADAEWNVTDTPDPEGAPFQVADLAFTTAKVSLNGGPDAPTSAPAAAIGIAGNVDAGSHKYRIAFVDSTGLAPNPSTGGPEVSIVLGIASQVNLSAIPVGPAGTTARVIYRTKAGGTTFYRVDTIADNTSTVYTDDIADAAIFEEMRPADSFWQLEIAGVYDLGFLKLTTLLWTGFKLIGTIPSGVYTAGYKWTNGGPLDPADNCGTLPQPGVIETITLLPGW